MIYIIQCDMSGMTAKFSEKNAKGAERTRVANAPTGKHGDVTTPAELPGLLAPDTSGMNLLGERSVPAHGKFGAARDWPSAGRARRRHA
jgi:hypothetical protein